MVSFVTPVSRKHLQTLLADIESATSLSRRLGVRVTVGLLAFLLAVFAASPVTTSFDSRWSIQTAMSFARGHGGDLTEYTPALKQNNFYAIEYPDGKPRTLYPIGTSLLAVPFVVVASIVDPSFENKLESRVLDRFEMVIASIFGAIAGCVFFWMIFCQFESLPIAFGSTAIFCFATPIWSTATRALWQHGPLVMMLVTAMLLLVRARQRPQLIQFVGLPLAMAYLIRPTAVVPVFVISSYVLLYHRKWFLSYVAWAMTIAVPWILFNSKLYGAPVSPYYWHNAFSETTNLTEGLLGSLFSPSRGLFVFSPVLLFAVSGFVIALRDPKERPLNIAYGAIIVGQSIIVGAGSMWWGGHSFGPRLMTDAVPFLAYFVTFNFRLPARVSPLTRGILSACITLFALISVLINAQGALRGSPMLWNVLPRNIDQYPSRAWDWRDPQFARTKAENARMQRQ